MSGEKKTPYWAGKHPLEYFIAGLLVLTFGASCAAAFYTRNEWLAEKDTERHELRAYVGVSVIQFDKAAAGKPAQASYTIKDFGQTPAYHLKHWARIEVRPMPYPGTMEFGASESSAAEITLFPGETIDNFAPSKMAVTPPVPLDQSSFAAIQTGKAALYVIGGMEYDDIFGAHHLTHFVGFSSGAGKELFRNIGVYSNGEQD